MKSLKQGLLRVGNDKVDNRCCTACQTGRGATEKVFAGDGAHKRQLHMRVGVDTTGHQILAATIDNFAAWGNIKISANRADQTVSAIYIRTITFIMGHKRSATN